MGKRTSFILIIIVLLGIRVSSQTNYLNGFIIDAKGDTTIGFIKNLSLIEMSQKCWFKTSDMSEAICYSPPTIKAFRFINGKYFESKVIMVGTEIKPIFLECLVNGKADLFSSQDKNGEHFYLQNENDSIYELLNSEIEIYKDDAKYSKYKNEYIGMMKLIFEDCPEIRTQIDKSEFRHKNLITLTKDYNNYVCKDRSCIIYDKDIKLKTSVGFIVGIYMSNIDFNAKSNYYAFVNGGKFQQTNTYSTGILISKKNIFGFSDNSEFNFIIGFKNGLFQSEKIRIAQQNLYIPIYLTRFLARGKFRPLVNFGVINKIHFKTDITSPVEIYKNYLNQSISSYDLGGLVGVGGEYKKNKLRYFINLNFEIGPFGINKVGAISNNDLSSITYDYGIIFGLKYDIN
jgi:hypothetical protein